MNQKTALNIRELYPDFSETELVEAEDNLDRYLALVLRVFERLQSETDPQVRQLTGGAGTVESNSQEVSG